MQRIDRLELFLLARDQARHVAELLRDLDKGRADIRTTAPILAAASRRLMTTLSELADDFNADPTN